jgi:hypothetical protein
VKIKKGFALVNKVKYLKVEKINSAKYFISTLDGEEFLSITIEKYGTGKHHAIKNPVQGQDTEIYHFYAVLKFLDNEEIGEAFEVDEGRLKNIIKMMYNSNIIADGKLVISKVKRMIEKYSENVSERRFLTKN